MSLRQSLPFSDHLGGLGLRPLGAGALGADIMLVMDHSGSMAGDKLSAAQAAAKAFVELLDARYHRVGLVGFSSKAELWLGPTGDPIMVLDAIGQLSAGGGTNITAAIVAADEALDQQGRPDALPVIILLSDGQNTVSLPPLTAAAAARNRGGCRSTPSAKGDLQGHGHHLAVSLREGSLAVTSNRTP